MRQRLYSFILSKILHMIKEMFKCAETCTMLHPIFSTSAMTECLFFLSLFKMVVIPKNSLLDLTLNM